MGCAHNTGKGLVNLYPVPVWLLRDAFYPVDSAWDREPLGFLFRGGVYGGEGGFLCVSPEDTGAVSIP